MDFAVSFKKFLIVVLAGLALTACATQKKQTGQMQSDVYTGTDTVEYLATGVRDRVFFFAVLRQNLPYYQIRAAKRPAILPDKRREAAPKRPDKDLARRFYQISIRICATS